MRFNLATIHVKNLENSLYFYHELLGLPIVRQFEGHGSTKIVMLGENGAPNLELVQTDAPKENPGKGVSIGFAVENLDKAMEKLRNKVPPFKGPMEPNAHVRFAFTLDPDGYMIQLLENR